ncbi:VOC family protein [Paenibacillus harenae]|uniref:VOC family protein n=1 Tax=Paenibacillus harenae TaxID=306543 RepID=UPI003592ED88
MVVLTNKRIDHVGIMVKDMEVSIRFYTEVMGFELKGRLPHTNGVIELAFLGFEQSDETDLELIQGYNDGLPIEGKVHHFAVTVDDIETEFKRLKQLEVRFVDEDITTLPNGYRYFFVSGPDGERIELFQR